MGGKILVEKSLAEKNLSRNFLGRIKTEKCACMCARACDMHYALRIFYPIDIPKKSSENYFPNKKILADFNFNFKKDFCLF